MTDPDDRLLRTSEVAARLKLSRNSVLKNNRLRALMIDLGTRTKRWKLSDIERMVEEAKGKAERVT